MNRRTPLKHAILALVFLVLKPAIAQTNSIVVPSVAEHVFGDTQLDPFFANQFGGGDQAVYPSYEFGATSADVIRIVGLAFRVDEHYTNGLSAMINNLLLDMGLFPGQMSALPTIGYLDSTHYPAFSVFSGKAVHISGRADTPESFDVKFDFPGAFLYDRRRGHLVVKIRSQADHTSPLGAGMDAQFTYDPVTYAPFQTGAYIHWDQFGADTIGGAIPVTKFYYTVPSAKITSIQKSGDTVTIEFSLSGVEARIESSSEISAGYSDESILPESAGPNLMRAALSASSKARFYRIRLF